MAQNVPLVSPACRPTRFMCSDAGMVPMAPPSTQQVTGRVARAVYGASANPASPLMVISVELLVKSIAWQAASRPTFRRGLGFFTVLGLETVIHPVYGPPPVCNN